MAEPEDNLRYAMEDQAWQHHGNATDSLALASIAVSLKRIADAIAVVIDPSFNEPAIRTRRDQ